MKANDIKKLMTGEKVEVLNGKGFIQLDTEANLFLAIVETDFTLDLHETFEEALNQIKEWEE